MCWREQSTRSFKSGGELKSRLIPAQLLSKKVVISVGRRPFADLLELGNADLATDESDVPVDDFCRTSQGIYAVGDLINSLS